jgi:hypothetical protein
MPAHTKKEKAKAKKRVIKAPGKKSTPKKRKGK